MERAQIREDYKFSDYDKIFFTAIWTTKNLWVEYIRPYFIMELHDISGTNNAFSPNISYNKPYKFIGFLNLNKQLNKIR